MFRLVRDYYGDNLGTFSTEAEIIALTTGIFAGLGHSAEECRKFASGVVTSLNECGSAFVGNAMRLVRE